MDDLGPRRRRCWRSAYLLLGLYALDLSEWSLTENLVAGAAVIGAAVLTWVIANAMRGRPWFDRPHEVGPVELAAFIIVPAIASLVVGQPLDALKTVIIAVVILAMLWAVTSYGVPALIGWAWQRTWSQFSTLLNVLARALPMLLLFSAFLFINAEAWQVAGTLTGIVYVAVLGIFFLLGATFVLIRIPALMRSLNQFDSWREIAELAASTPAAAVLDALHEPTDDEIRTPSARPIRQRVNIGLLTIFSQAIQITLVGLGLTGFFVLFGFLAIPEATALSWTQLTELDVLVRLARRRPRAGDHRAAAARRRLPRRLRCDVLHRPALDRLAVPRASSPTTSGPQLRQALAVRCVYRAARRAATT